MKNKNNIYKSLYLIRSFEQTLETYFSKGQIRGTTHGCIGQEVIAVAAINNINIEQDWITSNHRCHGHFLAITNDPLVLAAEIMGKNIGVLNGRGASQHIRLKHFLTNGITGGMIPIACGLALSKKLKNEPGIVLAFLGDGAMNEGYVMESLNLASIYHVPILFLLENNMYAMSTRSANVTAGNYQKRIDSYDIPYFETKDNDYFTIKKTFQEAYKFVKSQTKPAFMECKTFRFCGHSKSDKKEYMSQQEIQKWNLEDPLLKIRKDISEEEAIKIEEEVKTIVKEAFQTASSSSPPDPTIILKHVAN
ncbi:MAG: thiamine pyrophosphate-dependent dehydrogenase E1 component subunit alpha [Caldisericia bacterium]|nr:thiamine pyrophosphate-dependent dehydrogenase E1 component subunit alpha [Caldisericia bacterium]